MSFLFSTVFATPLQKLTAENAARQCKFSARVKGLPLLRSSGSPLVARSAKHTAKHTVCTSRKYLFGLNCIVSVLYYAVNYEIQQ